MAGLESAAHIETGTTATIVQQAILRSPETDMLNSDQFLELALILSSALPGVNLDIAMNKNVNPEKGFLPECLLFGLLFFLLLLVTGITPVTAICRKFSTRSPKSENLDGFL